jgi:hypothetical protein
MGCCCVDHKRAINTVYDNIVCALQQAELIAVPHVPVNSLKPFWNEHLDSLKEKSVFGGDYGLMLVVLDRVNCLKLKMLVV